MFNRRYLLLGLPIVAGAAAWRLWPAPRAERPKAAAELSDIVDLLGWQIDGSAIAADTVVPFTKYVNRQCTGSFKTDPKQWSNVARTYKLPGAKGYSKPFLHVGCRFASAAGDSVAISAGPSLLHSRSDQTLIKFKGPIRSPNLPGQYELQLAIGVEPPESPLYHGLPYEWQVIARCAAEVSNPSDE